MSDRAAIATPTRTPKAMYLVGVVFFVQAVICVFGVIGRINPLLRYRPASIAMTVGISICAACYGVYLLMRDYRAARWLMYAVTAYFVVIMVISPAEPFPPLYESPAAQYRNRAVIVLPMVASSLYLARRRRAT